MTAHDDLDRQLNDFLRDGPEELPYQSFDVVRDRTELTSQRVVIGPWRLPTMNKILTVGLGAVAVVVVLLVGAQLMGPEIGGMGGPGGDPTATPEPTATAEPTATPEPSAAAASAPPLTQTFTSTQHGISLSYPEGWTADAATGPWTDATFPLAFGLPHADWLADPIHEASLFLTIASQPIGDATPEDWLAAQTASEEGCAESEPIEVDGAAGLIGVDCDVVVVTTAGRGYWIQLYTSDDDPLAVAAYDRAWFEEILATVQLLPEEAADADPSTAP
jgi:hypothetical protein